MSKARYRTVYTANQEVDRLRAVNSELWNKNYRLDDSVNKLARDVHEAEQVRDKAVEAFNKANAELVKAGEKLADRARRISELEAAITRMNEVVYEHETEANRNIEIGIQMGIMMAEGTTRRDAELVCRPSEAEEWV